MILGSPEPTNDFRGVRVEFYGTARQQAGVSETVVDPGSLSEVMAQLEFSVPSLRGQLPTRDGSMRGLIVSLDGVRFLTDPAEYIALDAVLVILSPDVGG